ncbi:MAG: OB-fold domain-containing protein [Pseudomonadota bacterium]
MTDFLKSTKMERNPAERNNDNCGANKVSQDSPKTRAGEAAGPLVAPLDDLAFESRDDVITKDGAVFLLGARSASSGVEAFPARPICPETGARDMETAQFGPTAMLYSFATIHVSASRDVPYTLGYIDFPSGLRTLAHVRAPDEMLRCDLPVVLCAGPDGDWWVEPDGGAS